MAEKSPNTTQEPRDIDVAFEAVITRDANSGWACVLMPDSGTFFGTRKPVKIVGTLDDQALEATMLPVGNGIHMIPVKAALRKALGKDVGDRVSVHLTGRLT